MHNNIILAKQFIPILDEIYQLASLTSDLDGSPELVKAGANADEMCIPMIDMSGLGDYDRNSGYVNGDVSLGWETVKCNYDRGRMFQVDNMDNQESANIAFGKLASEFIRTKVAPEIDAFRFAAYAALKNISKASGTLADGMAVIAALRAATTKMDEDEVPAEERYLYITPTLKGMVDDLDTTKSKEVFKKFAKVIEVPQRRFYTAITLKSGANEEERVGGFVKADGAADINFEIIHKPAVIQFPKHIAPKVIDPSQNQTADAWKYGYRNVGIAKGYENKRAGIYVHHKGV